MNKSFFYNLQSITISELSSANKSIKAAVAWINFSYYKEVFLNLLNRGVKVKIIVNDDGNNRRYIDEINYLNSKGAKIKLLKTSGIMHHKFCIIDNCRCMFGSFNWTNNANMRNIEDLNICDDIIFVNNYRLEFKALWELSKSDLKQLRKPEKCESCDYPILNILFMEQEGDFETKVEVMQLCSCNQEIIYTDFFDISLYNNYVGTIEQFDDDILYADQDNDKVTYNQLISQQDFLVSNYLSFLRNYRMGCSIIHAVGIKCWRWITKDDGEYYYKIIWKERNTDNYINDWYDII